MKFFVGYDAAPMMTYTLLADKQEIWKRLCSDAPLHLYEIGDLDEFFWPHTKWFAGEENSLALLYTGMETPCLLAFERERGKGSLYKLLETIAPTFPTTVNAHVSPHLVEALAQQYTIGSSGLHKKMVLMKSELRDVDTTGCEALTATDLDEVAVFYEHAYPDNWFDPRMLETGYYTGYRSGGTLACVAGVHVYSATYAVAALGNIATSRSERRRGLAKRCTAHLCARLFENVDCIGLNVKTSNVAAIACYQGLGFREVADYCELSLRKST